MKKIKKGDIVARKSYGKDIIFYVKRIIKTINGDVAILCGLAKRIEADSKVEDLEIIDKDIVKERLEKIDEEDKKVTEELNKYLRELGLKELK